MFTLNCKGKLLVIDQPIVMGIINITPDSFYTGSRVGAIDEVLVRAEKMINDGAAILDIGGQSTRPKSDQLSVEDELRRVLPAIEVLHKNFPEQIISVDTYYSKVAKEAVYAGANIVNDVIAGVMDADIF
jgi:dihydropteroate synthase